MLDVTQSLIRFLIRVGTARMIKDIDATRSCNNFSWAFFQGMNFSQQNVHSPAVQLKPFHRLNFIFQQNELFPMVDKSAHVSIITWSLVTFIEFLDPLLVFVHFCPRDIVSVEIEINTRNESSNPAICIIERMH